MAFSSPFKLVAGMICGVSLLLIAENDLARAEKFPKVEREPVLADQKAHDTEWRTRIAASKSRVFFTDAEWPQVIAEVAKIDPQHPFRKYVDDALKKVLEKPVPTYYTPEEKVARKEAPSLYSAMEELWQRQVGEDLITLSLAVKLNLANDATLAACRTRMKELAMAACSWPTWGRGYRPMPDNADLSCGHLSLGLSYAYNLHGATVFTETERAMIRKAMREKVAGTLSGLYGAAYWATGYQDNHLQVDVAGLGVAGTVFYDEIPEAPEWMAAARLAHVNIARFSQTDGSSDEGIPYWSYARWATVHYIEGTRPVTRADSMYQDPFLKNAISWRLYSSTCGFAGTLPWGDAPPRDYYGPHFLLLQVGAACNDPTGLWLTEHLPFRPQGGSDGPLITLLFGRKAFAVKEKTPGEFVPGLDAHFPVNDGVTTSSGWSADDFIVALKSGFTNRNHSHLDAGALALAFGSKWSLRAPGYGKGSSQKGYWDSSKLRWTYFSNATESHTTFLVNGKNQRHDPKARGTVDEFLSAPRWAWASVDLTSACYDVAPSGGARRSLLHRRGEYALVLDSVNAADAAQPVKVEWLAHVIADPMPIKAESGFASNTLRIPGGGEAKNRELLITPLDAAQSFTRREPTAEHVDLPKESIRTYALSTTGAKVRFAVLLVPLPLASG
ncbi:MAG TPA: heparinase II/III family protein, partial [Candidatus Methylacidiphilales bacterium]|nr:heparinase II/III family protein [Candidatus Methylacidiphilales bacterium]